MVREFLFLAPMAQLLVAMHFREVKMEPRAVGILSHAVQAVTRVVTAPSVALHQISNQKYR